MAAPILSTMRTNVRLLTQDASTVSPGLTDAQVNTFINLALMWWYENYEKRVKYVTFVADWADGAFIQDGDATCLYPEIFEVSLKVGATDEDTPLDRMGWTELRARQTATAGTPTHWAGLKYGGAAVSASAQNKWKFALFPIPSANDSVLRGVVRDYPVALSADADIADLGDFEGKCVEIIASIFAAPRMGRPELSDDLKGLLPKMIQDKLETHQRRDEVNA